MNNPFFTGNDFFGGWEGFPEVWTTKVILAVMIILPWKINTIGCIYCTIGWCREIAKLAQIHCEGNIHTCIYSETWDFLSSLTKISDCQSGHSTLTDDCASPSIRGQGPWPCTLPSIPSKGAGSYSLGFSHGCFLWRRSGDVTKATLILGISWCYILDLYPCCCANTRIFWF